MVFAQRRDSYQRSDSGFINEHCCWHKRFSRRRNYFSTIATRGKQNAHEFCCNVNVNFKFHRQILLENLKIHLMEDRPPVNITSPGPVPINMNICKMRITRDDTGTFHIQPENHNATDSDNLVTRIAPRKDRELLSTQLVMQQLKLDNDMLKKKLATQEKSAEALK